MPDKPDANVKTIANPAYDGLLNQLTEVVPFSGTKLLAAANTVEQLAPQQPNVDVVCITFYGLKQFNLLQPTPNTGTVYVNIDNTKTHVTVKPGEVKTIILPAGYKTRLSKFYISGANIGDGVIYSVNMLPGGDQNGLSSLASAVNATQQVLNTSPTNRGPIIVEQRVLWNAYAHQATGEITADSSGNFSRYAVFLSFTKAAAAPNLTVALQTAFTDSFTTKWALPYRNSAGTLATSTTISATGTLMMLLPEYMPIVQRIRVSITSAATTNATNYYTITGMLVGSNF